MKTCVLIWYYVQQIITGCQIIIIKETIAHIVFLLHFHIGSVPSIWCFDREMNI